MTSNKLGDIIVQIFCLFALMMIWQTFYNYGNLELSPLFILIGFVQWNFFWFRTVRPWLMMRKDPNRQQITESGKKSIKIIALINIILIIIILGISAKYFSNYSSFDTAKQVFGEINFYDYLLISTMSVFLISEIIIEIKKREWNLYQI